MNKSLCKKDLEIALKHYGLYQKSGSLSVMDAITAAIGEALQAAQARNPETEMSNAASVEKIIRQMEEELSFVKDVQGDPMYEHGFEDALRIVKQAVAMRAVA